jgi:hypothetical protein
VTLYDEHRGVPRYLFKASAKEFLAQHERCEAIRRVDGDRNVDKSVTDVWLVVEQLMPRRWKATSIEPLTMHGQLVCYGHSEESVAGGAEAKMQALRMLIQSGRFNQDQRDECLEFVCTRLSFRAAETKRL